MQLYDCQVRLDGSVANEVPKSDATAAEIMLLRGIHGVDAVVRIKPTRSDKRSHDSERQRLKDVYMNPTLVNAESFKQKADLFRNLFGHDSMSLPNKLSEAVEPVEAEDTPERVKLNPLE